MNDELENNSANELEELRKENASLKGSLNYERSERKRLSKELASRQEDEQEDIKKAKEELRAKLKSGKSQLSDDVVDDLMETFGDSQATAQVKNAKQNIEREILELKRNPIYMNIEDYGSEIRSMMKQKGLTAEQAYWAVAGAEKYSNSLNKSQVEEEKAQKKQLTRERTKEGYVDTEPAGGEEKPQYSAKERAIADKLGISAEEAKARSKASFSIKEILEMNKKFKKGE